MDPLTFFVGQWDPIGFPLKPDSIIQVAVTLDREWEHSFEVIEKSYYDELLAKYNFMVDSAQQNARELQEDQVIEAISQAIRSGDFVRYVQIEPGGEKSAVSYIPFRENQSLKYRIEDLEGKLAVAREALNWARDGIEHFTGDDDDQDQAEYLRAYISKALAEINTPD